MTKKTQESYFSSSTVELFGRRIQGLKIDRAFALDFESGRPASKLSGARVASDDKDDDGQLARIYAMIYQGNYYRLATPTIFLVKEPGVDVVYDRVNAQNNTQISAIGTDVLDELAAANMVLWRMERKDFTLRLELERGYVDELLLDPDTGVTKLTAADNVIVGRDGANVVGRDGNVVGRDGNLVGRDGNLVARTRIR
jgi:hypothetical protein